MGMTMPPLPRPIQPKPSINIQPLKSWPRSASNPADTSISVDHLNKQSRKIEALEEEIREYESLDHFVDRVKDSTPDITYDELVRKSKLIDHTSQLHSAILGSYTTPPPPPPIRVEKKSIFTKIKTFLTKPWIIKWELEWRK